MAHKILLVDDSRTMREVLKVYLMGGAYEFIEADNAMRAIELVRLERPALVILDFNMPKMDGFACIKRIRASERPEMRDVPIILVSSDKAEDLEARSSFVTANGFLHKPIEATLLTQMVERLVGVPPP
jgi:two-component system, chemotaxis family, chemotaxis protein CheY